MLFSVRMSYQARPVAFRAAAPLYVRPFSQAQQMRLKEDSEKSPEEAGRINHEQIQKKEGTGHWHEEHAYVAADRENINNHKQHMNDLQKSNTQNTQKHQPDAKK